MNRIGIRVKLGLGLGLLLSTRAGLRLELGEGIDEGYCRTWRNPSILVVVEEELMLNVLNKPPPDPAHIDV